MESPFLGKFERLKVGIDLVVSESLKDSFFFTILLSYNLGVVKNVNKTTAKPLVTILLDLYTPAYYVTQ